MRWWQIKKRVKDLERELESDVELEEEEQRQNGLSPNDANYAARRAFGNLALIRERTYETWGWARYERVWQDIRYTVRQLRRSPGFTLTALCTLAIGIGAATGIFSIVNAWIFQPLPLKDPKQLVIIWRAAMTNPNEPAFYFSWRDYTYFLTRNRSFQSLSASFERTYTLTGAGEPTSLYGGVATGSLFETLGINAFRGRLFLPADQTGPAVAVISHSLWTARFHQSLSVLNETLTLNDKPFHVVGVLPPGFSFRVLDQPKDADVWTLIQSGDPEYQPDSSAAVAIVGRLKPGVAYSAAKSEIGALQTEGDRRYPNLPKSIAYLSGLQEDNTRTVKVSLFVLGGAVVLLLLIACTNIASLIVGRNMRREKEFAIRAALGSGTRRIVLQLVVENLLLFGVSAALGIMVAFGLIRGFAAWNPFGTMPARPITVNRSVLGLSGLITVLVGLMFSTLPVFRSLRFAINKGLRAGTSAVSTSPDKLRARSIIVLTQIALSVLLLVGATLVVKTLLRLESQPLGFNPSDTHVVTLALPHRRYGSALQITQFADRLSERLRTLPEVEAAGMTLYLRLMDAGTQFFQMREATSLNLENLPSAVPVTIGPGYLHAMGISIMAGRDFAEWDGERTLPVVLVNEEAARRYFPGVSPLGRHIRFGDPRAPETAKNPWLEIVGVIASTESTRYNQIDWEARPEIYTDYRQQQTQLFSENQDYTSVFFVARSRPGSTLSDASLQKAVWDVDANLPLGEVKSLGEMVAELRSQPRVRARMLGLFAGLTVLLAAIGIYGVMTQSVSQRHREIGVRLALGAGRANVVLLVLRQALGLVFAGMLAGTALGLFLARFMSSFLYGISANDPTAWLLTDGIVILVALISSYLPARNAAAIDPARSLRTE